jgi:molybdate transport system regulatory protein
MAGPKGSKYYDVFMQHKVWLEGIDKDEIISEPVFKLIKLIRETGSLKAAAEKLGISYRKAWGDLKYAEEKLGFLLVDKTRGGEHGGQSQLTKEGNELVDAYTELVDDINISIKKVTKKFFNTINKTK